MNNIDIGRRIKRLRQNKDLTLQELGQLVGVVSSTVHKWETGVIENMRRDNIIKLTKALNTTPEYLLGLNDDERDQPTVIDRQPKNDKTVNTLVKKIDNLTKILENMTDGQESNNQKRNDALFRQLDLLDQGIILGRMEAMLEADKYKKEGETSEKSI